MIRRILGLGLFLAACVAALVVLAPRTTGWTPEPRGSVGEALIFQEHFSLVPSSIYTPKENEALDAQIDPVRFLLPHKLAEVAKIFMFEGEVGAGAPAPDFALQTTDGEEIRLSELRGRPAVFMFVAMTCPPARAQVPRFEALQQRFGDQVQFFLVYSRERHPGEKGFPGFEYARTDAQKRKYAAMLAELTRLPVAVDGIDEHVLELYGPVPNSAYVIDRHGAIVFRSTWADATKIDAVLERLLAFERASAEAPSPAAP
jgi:thiol-disulfide isomerase/thioredoxin